MDESREASTDWRAEVVARLMSLRLAPEQEADLAEKRKQAVARDAAPPYSTERMSQEDAYLKAQLRSICRGC